jgi:hypothetical protein
MDRRLSDGGTLKGGEGKGSALRFEIMSVAASDVVCASEFKV